MAKLNGIKLPKPKKEKKVSASALELKHIGSEPIWDSARAKKFDDATFDHHLRVSFRYYNYFYSQKDMKKHVVAWAHKNMKLPAKQMSLYVLSNPELTPMTVCGLVKAESVGMPMLEKHKNYIMSSIMAAIEAAKDEPAIKEKVSKKEKSNTPTIQDRLAEKTAEIIGEVEGEVDNAFLNKPTANIYELITARNLAQSQMSKARAVFQRQIDEISEYMGGADEQLNESYVHLTKADIKRIGAFYVKLMADLDSYAAVKRATKKFKMKRPQSKDKMVAKVKYMKENKELKLASIPPIEIIGAQAVWVYQTKYRKIGKYVADEHSTLGIKGTSITGYSETKSVQKTLRKPADQLAAFTKAGKVALRTFLKDIKAVETKLNGRMNADILILKVEQ